MKVVAIIWARGLSGGLPRKNLLPIHGRPMIAHAFEALRASGVVDRTFVFTEDPDIAAEAAAAGVAVIPRSKDQLFYNGGFSDPATWSRHVFEHVTRAAGPLESLVTMNVNCNFCLLRGTTVARMLHALMEHESATEIIGVTRVEPHLFTVNPATGTLFPVWHEPGLDRQKYPPLYRLVGAVEMCHRLRASRTQIPRRLFHEMPAWEALDVQTPDDVEMAEYFLARRRRGGAASRAAAEPEAALRG